MFKTKVTLTDGIILLLLLLCTLLAFWQPFRRDEKATSLTVVTGEGSETYSLFEDRTFQIESNGISLTVEIAGGRARVVESHCPDHICQSTGWIENSGETILCVPAGIRITITGGGGEDVDFVAG